MGIEISGINSDQQLYKVHQVRRSENHTRQTAPQYKQNDIVTISAEGKQMIPLRTDGSTPTEEAKESPLQRDIEGQAGKK